MTKESARPRGSRLVQQDIIIRREEPADPRSRVVAHVHCAQRGCAMDVKDCANCPHFARIEVHEAGYVLLCHGEEDANAERPGSARARDEDVER